MYPDLQSLALALTGPATLRSRMPESTGGLCLAQEISELVRDWVVQNSREIRDDYSWREDKGYEVKIFAFNTNDRILSVVRVLKESTRASNTNVVHVVSEVSRSEMCELFALTLFLLSASVALASDIVGRASVIDGDTLEIHGTRIRLWGINAPESSQLCRNDESLQYRCGAKAANDLDALARRPVECSAVSLDQYGRTVAICSIAGVDVA